MNRLPDFVNPDARSYDIRSRNVLRFNNYPIIKSDNIAEHSFSVALYDLFIYHNLVKQNKDKINLANLLVCATTHDLAEIYTGDLITDTKHYDNYTELAFSKLEDDCNKEINKVLLGTEENIYKLNKYEKFVHKAADYLSALTISYREVELGNKYGIALKESIEIKYAEFLSKESSVKLIEELGIDEDLIRNTEKLFE